MLTGIFLSVGGAFCHSLSFIFRKRGLETVDYKVFISLRILVGVIISVILLWSIDSGLSGLSFNAAWPFIITGVMGNVFGLIATTMAIHEIGAILVSTA